ncbi:MAG: tetratricopeptide repeat protein [Saprospiraceae bacterium]|nr:tetratricopeptide repeat protein [Saprospiraceae bacterium]
MESALALKAWSEQIGNIRGQIGGISFMALVMSDRDQTDKAITHYHQAIELCKEVKDMGRLANMYNNLAGAYLKQKSFDEALKYYHLTKEIDEQDGYTWGIFNSYHNIGNVHLYTEEFDQAYVNLQKAYHLQQQIGSVQELNMTENKLGYAAAKLGKPEGIAILKDALRVSRENAFLHVEEQGLKYLSEIYEDRNQLKEALSYHKAYKDLSDKIYRQQVVAKTDELQIQYEAAEQEAEISTLNSENQIQALELIQARQTRWALILGLLGLSLLAALLCRNNRFRKQVNKALSSKNRIIEENLAEKEMLLREIHHRVKNNLQIVSSLLNLQSRNVSDKAARDAILEGQNRVKSMAIIHQNLYQKEDLIGVDTGQYISKLVDSLVLSYNIEPGRIAISTDIDAGKQDVDVMIPLGLVTNELVSNALKHAFPDGRSGQILVSLKKQDQHLKLSVKDNGVGTPGKGIPSNPTSMGMKIVQAFTKKLDGKLSLHHPNGAEFVLEIPIFKRESSHF